MLKKSKVRKVGNSLGLTLPLEITRALDLQDGDEISIHVKNDSIVLERFDPQLLEQMQAYHAEMLRFKNLFRALD